MCEKLKIDTQVEFEEKIKIINPNIKITGEYKGKKKKIEYHCNICGNNHSATPSDLLRGFGCPVCAKERVAEFHRLGRETILKNINEKWDGNIEILTPGKILTNQEILCKCKKDDFEWYTIYNELMIGHGCPLCRLKEHKHVNNISYKLFTEYLKYVSDDKIKLITPEKDFNYSGKMQFKCIIFNQIWESKGDKVLKNPESPFCKKERIMEENGKKQLEKIHYYNKDIYFAEKYKGSNVLMKFKNIKNNKVWTTSCETLVRKLKDEKAFDWNGDKKRVPLEKQDFSVLYLHPEIEIFIKNKEDIKGENISGNKKITTVCPICGTEKEMTISSLIQSCKKGYSCLKCADGVSFPNKIIRNLILALPVDKYYFEKSFEWSNKYRFDAVFEKDGKMYFCEMDGGFHKRTRYESGPKMTLEEIKQRDADKDKMVKEHNGVMIRIDCDPSTFKHIKEQIYNSLLNDLFDLNSVDWKEINIQSLKNFMFEVCKYYNENEGISISELAEKFNVCYSTIGRYLRIGARLNLCKYDGKKELMKNLKKADESKKKPIKITNIKTMETNIFPSIEDCAYFLLERFPEKTLESFRALISYICRGKRKNPVWKNYTFSFLN